MTRRVKQERPIRVIRVIDRLNIGGPAKHVVWLASGLNHGEFETLLISGRVPSGEGDMGYFAQEAGVQPLMIKELSRELSPRDLLVIAKLFMLFFRLRPHIIHTHKAKAGAAGRIAAFLYKWLTPSVLWRRPRPCRIVHTYHGHIFHSYYGMVKTKLFLVIERLLARFCTDRIVVVSQQQRRELVERYRVGRPEQYVVIPLGIDLKEKTASHCRLRAELGVSKEVALIAVIGRLTEIKNISMFLDVAARLSKDGLVARYLVIGDGHLRTELQLLAHQLEIGDLVSFTGFRHDVLSLYSDLDLVALTSLNEGTPLTLIEALACRCPVVATEVGGVCDLMGKKRALIDGFWIWDHGITVPSRDVDTFTSAVRYLIEQPDLRRLMGARGQAFVRTYLSRDRLVGDIAALYRELLGRAAGICVG